MLFRSSTVPKNIDNRSLQGGSMSDTKVYAIGNLTKNCVHVSALELSGLAHARFETPRQPTSIAVAYVGRRNVSTQKEEAVSPEARQIIITQTIRI